MTKQKAVFHVCPYTSRTVLTVLLSPVLADFSVQYPMVTAVQYLVLTDVQDAWWLSPGISVDFASGPC